MKRILVGPDSEIEVEFDPAAFPLTPLEEGTTLVLRGARVHRVTHANGRLLVNGKEVRLSLADPRNRRRNANNNADSGRRDIKAAMPGKVIKILVETGQSVEPAEGLLILEAMKMQNEVRSPGAGRSCATRRAGG